MPAFPFLVPIFLFSFFHNLHLILLCGSEKLIPKVKFHCVFSILIPCHFSLCPFFSKYYSAENGECQKCHEERSVKQRSWNEGLPIPLNVSESDKVKCFINIAMSCKPMAWLFPPALSQNAGLRMMEWPIPSQVAWPRVIKAARRDGWIDLSRNCNKNAVLKRSLSLPWNCDSSFFVPCQGGLESLFSHESCANTLCNAWGCQCLTRLWNGRIWIFLL